MVTVSLDASALLRFLDREAGEARVEAIFDLQDSGEARVVMSAVHWAEVTGIFLKRVGPSRLASAMFAIDRLSLEIIPVTQERATQAARLRHRYKLPLADSFGLEIAADMSDHILLTADFDVKPAAEDISIEFLPAKTKA